jgi:lambda family phage portal protein
MPGLIERALSVLSPPTARKRATAMALSRARMAYDGATTGRRAQGWRVVSTDANAENQPSLGRLRDVARDMVRNNPHAARGKWLIANNVVGTGIIPSVLASSAPKTVKKKLDDLMKAHFDRPAIDTRGRMDLYGLQALAMGTVVESGEVLVRWRPRRAEDGLPLPFQLEVLEPDYLDASRDGLQSNGNYCVQGIEFDLIGRTAGYWLHKQHPGSSQGMGSYDSGFVPADQVAHIFRTDRPGQARGVTWFSPVIVKMRDLADYSDAQLVRQKVAACFAAFVHSEQAISSVLASAAPIEDQGGDYLVESLEPGIIQRLKPGEEVSFGTPPSVGDYAQYKAAELRDIAVGLGVSYEALSGDLTGVNFSSGRMGWLEFQRTIASAQASMIAQLCLPVERWFREAAGRVAGRSLADVVFQWTPPKREMINPKEEVAAARDAIRAGLSSRPYEQKRLGFDPEDLDAENQEANSRADDMGLIHDSDARLRSAAGNPMTGGDGF